MFLTFGPLVPPMALGVFLKHQGRKSGPEQAGDAGFGGVWTSMVRKRLPILRCFFMDCWHLVFHAQNVCPNLAEAGY